MIIEFGIETSNKGFDEVIELDVSSVEEFKEKFADEFGRCFKVQLMCGIVEIDSGECVQPHIDSFSDALEIFGELVEDMLNEEEVA